MSNQISTTIIMCIIFGLCSFYYFNKFQESEKEYTRLHKNFDEMYMENQKMKSRIKDLQSYKNDVSKTMKILDNELVLINNHIQKQNTGTSRQGQTEQNFIRPYLRMSRSQGSQVSQEMPRTNYDSSRNNISLLSPELLSSLFNNINQENVPISIPYNNPFGNQQYNIPLDNRQNNNPVGNQQHNNPVPPKEEEDKLKEEHKIIDDQINMDKNETNMDDTETNIPLNEKVININYDITYSPNQNSYEQFLIDK